MFLHPFERRQLKPVEVMIRSLCGRGCKARPRFASQFSFARRIIGLDARGVSGRENSTFSLLPFLYAHVTLSFCSQWTVCCLGFRLSIADGRNESICTGIYFMHFHTMIPRSILFALASLLITCTSESRRTQSIPCGNIFRLNVSSSRRIFSSRTFFFVATISAASQSEKRKSALVALSM